MDYFHDHYLWNCFRVNATEPLDDKTTLVLVMAWYCKATSHFSSQCFPNSISPYGVTRPQWVEAKSRTTINTLRPAQNGWHFADGTLKCSFLIEKFSIRIQISQKWTKSSLFTPQPLELQGYCCTGPGRWAGGYQTLRNTYYLKLLEEFFLFESSVELHPNLKLCNIIVICPFVPSELVHGPKHVQSGTIGIQTLWNTYLWKHWMDLHCSESELSKPVVVQHCWKSHVAMLKKPYHRNRKYDRLLWLWNLTSPMTLTLNFFKVKFWKSFFRNGRVV